MPYLIKNIHDLNNSFIVNPYESKYFDGKLDSNGESLRNLSLNFLKYHLPKSEHAIYNSFKLYNERDKNIEIEKDYDKAIIDLSDYEQPLNYAILDFRILTRKLNISVFQEELEQSISKYQKYFIKDVDSDALNADTKIQVSHYLSLYLKDLEESINFIKTIDLSKIQMLVGELHIKSYYNTVNYINKTYIEYLPEIDDDSLDRILVHNCINKFLTIESELIKHNFIIKMNNSMHWKGLKVQLVNFCRLLLINDYILNYRKIGKVITFFEDRYNLDTGDQAKPSKFKQTGKVIEVDFHFLNF